MPGPVGLPEFLKAEPIPLWRGVSVEVERSNSLPRKRAARAFGEHRVTGAYLGSRREGLALRTGAGASVIARRHPATAPPCVRVKRHRRSSAQRPRPSLPPHPPHPPGDGTILQEQGEVAAVV